MDSDVNFNPATLPAVTSYGGIPIAASGLSPIRGADDRQSISATDGSALTVYAVPATRPTPGKYQITVTIVGRSGTITSAVYTYKYTVGGNTITKTVSISAVDTDAENTLIVQPDANTSITGQITTLTGTTPVIDVTCIVEAVSAGT